MVFKKGLKNFIINISLIILIGIICGFLSKVVGAGSDYEFNM